MTNSENNYEPTYDIPENPFVEHNGAEIFRAELKGSSSKLLIMESDTNFLLEIAQLSGFINISPQTMINKLYTYQQDEAIRIRTYNNFITNEISKQLVSIN